MPKLPEKSWFFFLARFARNFSFKLLNWANGGKAVGRVRKTFFFLGLIYKFLQYFVEDVDYVLCVISPGWFPFIWTKRYCDNNIHEENGVDCSNWQGVIELRQSIRSMSRNCKWTSIKKSSVFEQCMRGELSEFRFHLPVKILIDDLHTVVSSLMSLIIRPFRIPIRAVFFLKLWAYVLHVASILHMPFGIRPWCFVRWIWNPSSNFFEIILRDFLSIIHDTCDIGLLEVQGLGNTKNSIIS